MHCKNTTFICHDKFNKYMKVEKATSEDIFDYFLDIEVKKFYQKKKRDIYMIYLRHGIQIIFNLMNILMII